MRVLFAYVSGQRIQKTLLLHADGIQTAKRIPGSGYPLKRLKIIQAVLRHGVLADTQHIAADDLLDVTV